MNAYFSNAARALTDRKQSGTKGLWITFAAIAVSALNLRLGVTSLSPLLQKISLEFGFDTGTIGVFGMLPPACFALFGTMTPLLVRKFGLENTAAFGLMLVAIGTATRALSSDTESFIALTILTLAGAGVAGVVIPPLVRVYFPKRIAYISTVYLIAMHLGALIPPLIAVPMSEIIGWRLAIALWSVVAVIASLLWVTVKFMLTHKRERALAETTAPQVTLGFRDAVRSPTLWNLTILYGMTSWNVFILFTWLPRLVIDSGHSAGFAGAMVSLLIGVSMLIGVFAPSATVRLRNPAPLILFCVGLYGAGYSGLALGANNLVPLWVIFLGAASSLFIVATTMINTHSRTAAGSATTSAFVQGIGGAIALFGPILFGQLQRFTGTWSASYCLVALSLVVMAIAGIREREHGTIEDDLSTLEKRP